MVEHRDLISGLSEGYSSQMYASRDEARQPGEISKSGASVPASAPASSHEAVILSTKRLTLRPPHERDLEQLVELANNPRVAKNLGTMPHPYTREDGLNWISMGNNARERTKVLAITDRFDDSFLGACAYHPMMEHRERTAIGYWLGEPYWGEGLAAEATQAMIDYAFDYEPIQDIWVTARTSNYQSKRVIEKCGFQFVHNGMAPSVAVGGMVPIDYFSLSRKTWESLHSWGSR